MTQERYIDKSAIIADSSTVGHFSVIKKNCRIGKETYIGCHVCISEDVVIGDGCIIGDETSICSNVEIGNNAYIEPFVIFTESLMQRAGKESEARKTIIGKNVTIHSRAVIESGSVIKDNTTIEYGEIVKCAL